MVVLTPQLGPNGHLLTFPVANGRTLNVVAFHQDDGEWLDSERLTRQGTRAQALKDFEGWTETVRSLLSMCEETLSVVSVSVQIPASGVAWRGSLPGWSGRT